MSASDNTSVITIGTPQKIFFSEEPAKYKVKNNFYFLVSLNDLTPSLDGGETYPKIYIKGLEELFTDDEQRTNTLDALVSNFKTGGNASWKISWGKPESGDEEDCLIIDYLRNNTNADVKFELSERCVFSNYPGNLLTLTAYAYGFNGIEDGTVIPIPAIICEYAAYVKDFGGYVKNSKVDAVYKGEKCNISWKFMGNENVSVFLYDENGMIVANLPGEHNAVIDKDKKFTLMVHSEYCTQVETIIIHRTLWKKRDNNMKDFPQTDSKGRFKFYKSSRGRYYLYVHPKLYESKDSITWRVLSVNSAAPQAFSFYSSSFSEDRFAVCYLSDTKTSTYCEMSFNDNTWKEPIKIEKTNAINAHVFLTGQDGVTFVLCDEKQVVYAKLYGNMLINPVFLQIPQNAVIKAVDILDNGGRQYIAVLTKGGRVYFYDIDNDFKNNIFECINADDDYIHLVKSNAVYIASKGYMLEVSDREKFTDVNFSPNYQTGTRPVIGNLDSETIIGVFSENNVNNIWEYKF